MPDTRELTYGEKAVGLTFNHAEGAAHDAVNQAKVACAGLIDLVYNTATPADSRFLNGLRTTAINAIITAQMLAVKVITWKD